MIRELVALSLKFRVLVVGVAVGVEAEQSVGEADVVGEEAAEAGAGLVI